MNGTVLIIDDDVNTRIITETLLRTQGITVQVALDGIEACDIVQRDGASVVVVDLELSGMNGWEVIRRLRGRFEAIPPAAQPRIVAVTSRTEPETERFALRLGADACLRKPLPPARFVQTVERLLAGPSWMQPDAFEPHLFRQTEHAV